MAGYGSGITWERTPEKLADDMQKFGMGMQQFITFEAEKLAHDIEIEAKIRHPWTNRSYKAEDTLSAKAIRAGDSKIQITLAHGMPYGVFLELANAGKWGVIQKTLQKFYPEVLRRLEGMFGEMK